MAYHPFRHLGLKVMALALAALLWLTVAGEHVVERIIRVPVEFRNIPAQLEVVGDPPSNVDVRLRGSSTVLGRLEVGDVVAELDLANARAGSRIFHIRNEEVRTPYGVEVTQVVPGTVGIELEKSVTRVVPVVAQIDGDPAPGFSVGQVTAEPSTVAVSGPESRLKKLANATTEPVDVAGAIDNVRDVVAVGVLDSTLRLVQPQNVTVIVDILPASIQRQLQGVVIQPRNLEQGLRASQIAPGTVAAEIRGRRDVVTSVRPEGIEAFVDLAGLEAGRYNLRVQFNPSQQFSVSEFNPAEVAVTIKSRK
jgi:YbbR domain-containing protein